MSVFTEKGKAAAVLKAFKEKMPVFQLLPAALPKISLISVRKSD